MKIFHFVFVIATLVAIGGLTTASASAHLEMGNATPGKLALRGTVEEIDPMRGDIYFRNDPTPKLSYVRTTPCSIGELSDLEKIHPGERVDVVLDTRKRPWVLLDIDPAPTQPLHRRP